MYKLQDVTCVSDDTGSLFLWLYRIPKEPRWAKLAEFGLRCIKTFSYALNKIYIATLSILILRRILLAIVFVLYQWFLFLLQI